MPSGSLAWRRLMEYLDENRDAFENDISNRTNVLDIAAHYPYSPERWRIFVDGSRVFPEYGSVSQYTHDTDRHLLQPAAGETVVYESAERPRYVVQYELVATFAFTITQSLASGDSIAVGLYDGTDGWYFEQTGSHADDEADFVIERAGSVIFRESDRSLARPTTKFSRLALETGWYDITRQRWEQSFPSTDQREDGDEFIQQNELVATTAAPDQRGPQTGNLPIHFEVTASDTTTDLVMEAGSAAQVNLGDTTPLKRTNQHTETVNLDATDTWVPLLAFREDPDREIVNTQLVDVAINEFGGQGDVELAVLAFDPSKVLDTNGDELAAGDFSTPEIFLRQNTVIETSTAVEQIPDETGTTATSQTDPGGIQIGHDTLQSDTGGNQTTSNTGTAVVAKRPIYARDVGVVVAKSEATGDVTFSLRYEEDW